jgi:squalene-associated FAD-dependent desaturase
MKIAIIGGGWSGLAAAVRAVSLGHHVTLLEMAPDLGGRARTVNRHGRLRDNGQHILIGAYTHTLDLMRLVGADLSSTLYRTPLCLMAPDGQGLALTGRSSIVTFAAAVLRNRSWTWRSRIALLRASTVWALKRFECSADLTVQTLTQTLPPEVRQGLVEPLCVAALNTPAYRASARVFLRVLKDSLMSGSGGADLLLPSRPLGELLPQPAQRWLEARGTEVVLRERVNELQRLPSGWRVGGRDFDAVVLACSAVEAARLTQPHHPQWSVLAARIPHEAITTIYLNCPGAVLQRPMTFLPSGPAQFVFDLDALGHPGGGFAFVISAADAFENLDREALAHAVVQQALSLFPAGSLPRAPQVTDIFTEQRATFRCEPGTARPPRKVTSDLWAAGDYIDGPYPATLEGAVRSGEEAVDHLVQYASAMQNTDSNRASP